MAPDERIRFVLELEYGYVLDKLKDKKFEEIEVKTRDLKFSNEEYRKKVESGIYLDHNLPIGIYLKDGENYRLIDGYHRLIDSQGKKKVKIIYGS